MTSTDLVRRAIKFDNPERIPIWFFNRDYMQGDILCFDLWIEEQQKNEWGYEWKRLDDGTMGQPSEPVIGHWGLMEDFLIPPLNIPKRFRGIYEFKKNAGGRYLLGSFGITGFTTYTFLRGFENAMVDFAEETEYANELLNKIYSFENGIITEAAKQGLDGIHFADDWGTQHNLIIAPGMWRDIFKPRYRRQFEYAHHLGLDVWFHSCGNILSIVPDLSEIGVDVLNISQPNVVDISKVGNLLRGKQCFMMPISYQTVSITGTPDDIKAEVKRLYEELGTEKGGFIGYVEDYSCMGMSEENYQACVHAFQSLL